MAERDLIQAIDEAALLIAAALLRGPKVSANAKEPLEDARDLLLLIRRMKLRPQDFRQTP